MNKYFKGLTILILLEEMTEGIPPSCLVVQPHQYKYRVLPTDYSNRNPCSPWLTLSSARTPLCMHGHHRSNGRCSNSAYRYGVKCNDLRTVPPSGSFLAGQGLSFRLIYTRAPEGIWRKASERERKRNAVVCKSTISPINSILLSLNPCQLGRSLPSPPSLAWTGLTSTRGFFPRRSILPRTQNCWVGGTVRNIKVYWCGICNFRWNDLFCQSNLHEFSNISNIDDVLWNNYWDMKFI